MNLRRVTSLTALLSFTVLAASGVILFLTPQGRVAYWSQWQMLGLGKEAWAALHILLSLLFLVVSIVHILLNLKVILHYLRDKARQVRPFTPEMGVAVALTAAFTVGPLMGWAPFSWVMALNDSVKASASRSYGEPPYGHAEQSTLKAFAQRTGMDLGKAQDLLKARGLAFNGPEDKLQEIATRNRVTPQQVYLAIKEAEAPKGPKGQLPEDVAPGLGRKNLQDLCTEYGLDPVRVRTALEARQIKVNFGQSMRALAEANGTGPHELYALLRDALK